MSSSREGSPDWLRCFQAPTHSVLTLSSDSESSPNDSPLREDINNVEEPSNHKTSPFLEKDKYRVNALGDNVAELPPFKNPKSKTKSSTSRKKKKVGTRKKGEGSGSNMKDADEEISEKHIEPCGTNLSAWTISSDSESCPDDSFANENAFHHEGKEKDVITDSGVGTAFNGVSEENTMKMKLEEEECTPTKRNKTSTHVKRKGNGDEAKIVEVGEHTEPQVSSSRLPLLLSEKVHLSKVLVECEGESIDLSGDMGAVGRIVISDTPSKNHEMLLDLKGTIYKTTIVPSRTFCLVSFGQSEAKIEAIMNDFLQLKPQSNVYEAETMVEGTLEGFLFDSEDEVDKMPKAVDCQIDKKEGAEEHSNSKPKGKAEKTSGVVRKRGRSAGGKAPKKAGRKAQALKKTKTKK